MNTDSQVTVHYSRRDRVVDLDRGEAHINSPDIQLLSNRRNERRPYAAVELTINTAAGCRENG
jgi:hypothetical protein